MNDLSEDPTYETRKQELSGLLTDAILESGDQFLTPKILSSYSSFQQGPVVSITKSFDALKLHMSSNGSEPTLTSPEYKASFELDSSTTIKVKAFYNGEAVSETIERRVNVIDWLSEAELETDPSPRYSSGGIFTLLDGDRGTLQHGGGKWLGYQDNKLASKIDLGKVETISSIHLGCLTSPGSWIFWPEYVSILTSVDGENWTEYFEYRGVAEEKGQSSEIKDVGTRKGAAARYIRIEADPVGSIPEWHDGKGSKGWLFVDEILIETK
jgi:hypothetical protein